MRHTLNSALSRESKRLAIVSPGRTSAQSHTNYRHCSTPEKSVRTANVKHTSTLQKKVIDRLKHKIDKCIQKSSLDIEENVSSDLVSIMKSHSMHVLEKHGEESFLGIFWTQQLKAATAADSRGRRWHPLAIKWCLYLHHLSSKAYETIRNSGIITLPSSRTFRDYTHLHSTKMGFSIEADRQLFDLLKQKDELTKYGVVLIDEM